MDTATQQVAAQRDECLAGMKSQITKLWILEHDFFKAKIVDAWLADGKKLTPEVRLRLILEFTNYIDTSSASHAMDDRNEDLGRSARSTYALIMVRMLADDNMKSDSPMLKIWAQNLGLLEA